MTRNPHRLRPPLAVKLRLHKLLTFIGSHCPHGWVDNGVQRHTRYDTTRKANREAIEQWLVDNLTLEELAFLEANKRWVKECIV
jgi:hypothetical protein